MKREQHYIVNMLGYVLFYHDNFNNVMVNGIQNVALMVIECCIIGYCIECYLDGHCIRFV